MDCGNERACGLFKVRMTGAVGRAVGGDSGGREELAKATSACREIRSECPETDGDLARRRPPLPIVRFIVAAVRKPGGVADQLERLTARAPRILEHSQGHPATVDLHAVAALGCPGIGGWAFLFEQVAHARELEHVADFVGIGHDPESPADLRI